MNPKIKNLIIFSAIFILLVVGYVVFFRGSSTPALTTTTGAALPAATAGAGVDVGQEFLSTLLNLKNIKLDDAVFNNPAFDKLQDYTITLVPEGNEGRLNPFAPIGTDFSGSTFFDTSTVSSTTTTPSTTSTTPPATTGGKTSTIPAI